MQRALVLSLPLTLTLSRLVLGPLFLLFYLYESELGIPKLATPFILLSISGYSELSDFFDGYFARKFKQVTDLGKLLDPMTDSVFRISVFLTFTQGLIKLPLIVVLLFFYRDMVIGTLRTVCALKGFALAARWSGKVKAFLQGCTMIAILTLMIPYHLGYISLEMLRGFAFWTTLPVALYTLGSGLEYLYANREHIKKALS